MVDFIFVIIELFCDLLRLRRYNRKSVVEVGVFRRGWVTFDEYFGWKETISSNPRWSGKTRDTSVSYGVEILTDDYSEDYFRLTDGRTDGRTDRQNRDSNIVRRITVLYRQSKGSIVRRFNNHPA